MNEFQPLIDQLYREEMQRVRAMTPQHRFGIAMEICEENFRWARALGDAEMHRRYEIKRPLDDHGCYGPPVPRL